MKKNRSTRLFLIVSMGSMTLLYGVFFVFPMGFGLVGSFTNWNPFKETFKFVALANYRRLFADSLFYKSLGNTLLFSVACVIICTGSGLLLAVLVQSVRRGRGIYKALIYMPYITAIVTISIVWRWFFAAQGGLFNSVLSALGLPALEWLNSAKTVWPSLAMITIWHDVGFALILFIAGLSEIPQTYYEAAEIDGANRFQIFGRITLPLLAPTTALVAISNTITYIQVYDQILALTRGGPGDASYSISYYLFSTAIGYQRFGLAAATAVIMLVLILTLSYLQMRLSAQYGA